LFWIKIAEGLSSEDAAAAIDASQPVGGRWFRHGGGLRGLRRGPVRPVQRRAAWPLRAV